MEFYCVDERAPSFRVEPYHQLNKKFKFISRECFFAIIQAVLTIQTSSAISKTNKIHGQMSPSTVAEWIKNSHCVPPKTRSSWSEPNRIVITGQSVANISAVTPLTLLIFTREYIPAAKPQTEIIPINHIIIVQSHSFVKF